MADIYKIDLNIFGREGRLFHGPVSSLSSVNKTGKFDILPQHSNFITLIQSKIVYRDAISNQVHEVPISTQAILKAVGNEVNIFIGM